jgi:hypothetical protein
MSTLSEAERADAKSMAQWEIAKCIVELPLDDWRRTLLACAIAALNSGDYGLAASVAGLARSATGESPTGFQADPEIAALDHSRLEAALETVVQKPPLSGSLFS